MLEAFKRHPSVAPLIAGSEVKEYAAHLIPEGGFKAVPQLFGDGWVICGDAGQLNNAVHREGSNLAMTSGRMAGEAIFQIKSRRDKMTADNLSLYKKMLDESFVMKDLKKHKDMPGLLHTQASNLFLTYPQLVSKAMENFVRVDGTPKIDKEKDTVRRFRKARGLRPDRRRDPHRARVALKLTPHPASRRDTDGCRSAIPEGRREALHEPLYRRFRSAAYRGLAAREAVEKPAGHDASVPGRLLFTVETGQVELTADGCLECGTCRVLCEESGEITWNYPRGGYGILFKFG